MEPLKGLERIYDEDYDLGDSDEDIRGSDSEAEDEQNDDFEAEMQAELSRKMAHRREQQMGGTSSNGDPADNKRVQGSEGATKDSKQNPDDEDEEGDLLYDPSLDDEDEQWVDERRRKNLQAHLLGNRSARNHTAQSYRSGETVVPLPQSDAVLNCPACMTLLCRDCQRHEVYGNQYRAMFVENCRVDEDTKLACPQKGHMREGNGKSRKRRKGSATDSARASGVEDDAPEEEHPIQQATADTSASDLFHPVFCNTCNTQVAVMGVEDEVYHFYNIVTSHS